MEGWSSETKSVSCRTFIAAACHDAPQQIPEHDGRIERIDGTRTPRSLRCSTADVLKAERPGHPQLYLFVVVVVVVVVVFPRLPPFYAAGMRPI